MQPSVQLLSEAFLTNLRSYIKIKQKLWQLSLHSVENLDGFYHVQIQQGTSSVLEPAAIDKQDRSY